jgi:KDO2-lipid IV(A) lauroyltransferase
MRNRKFAAATHLAEKLNGPRDPLPSGFVRAHAGFVVSYYVRFAMLWSRPLRSRLLSAVRAQGTHHLEAAIEVGRGAVLVSVHLGDFDVAGAWLADRHGVTPVVVSQRLRPGWRDWLFCEARRRSGVVVRDARETRLVALERDLEQGRFVLGMLDRDVPGPSTASVLLGQPAQVSLALAVLCVRTGAPLLPAVTWREPTGEVVAWFGAPTWPTSVAQAVDALQHCASQLEPHLLRHQTQWHVPASLDQSAWKCPGHAHVSTRASEVTARRLTA